MKAISKRVLSLGLSLAMVASVVAVPSTEAQAATGIAKSKTYYAGQTKTLNLTTSSSWKSVKTTWSTSKKSIVKIAKKTNKTVTINCVKAGKANVTAKVSFKKGTKKYTKKYTCKVTVKNPTFEVSAGQTTLKLGETTAIKVTKKPASAVVKYSSDDAAIAKISGGRITATGIGTTKINARLKIGNQTVARKSVEITVVPSEDGITATLSNPFTEDYKNTVLVNQNAILTVACVRDGKPVAGETMVLALNKGADDWMDYEIKGSATATTNSNGIAAFAIGHVKTTPALKASSAGHIASVNYTISIAGATDAVEGAIDFAAVTYSKVNILNNCPEDAAIEPVYKNLVPGTNYPTTTGGEAKTASMDLPEVTHDEYVESQQVSSQDSDEHAVYVGGGYPEIVFPNAAADLSTANKKIETINVAYGPYDTYEEHSEYVTLTEDPSKLTYAALNFDYLKLSKYTHARIASFASEQDAKDERNPKNPRYYTEEQNQGAFSYQIPLESNTKCVKITIYSAGQVDTAMNAGFKASSIEYVYKTGSGNNTLPVKGADVTWNIVDTQYTSEDEVPAYFKTPTGYTIGGKAITLASGETLTYKMPRFPYTGTAILTHYDANKKVIAYYAYSTVNNGQNQNVLGQPAVNYLTTPYENRYNNNGICYEITSDELRDKVGTIVTQDGSVAKVNSYQSGRTTLEGTVKVNGKVVEALDAETNTMYTSIQWNPIKNSTAAADAFVAFTGQTIEVIAQLVDKNGNAVTQQGKPVTFYYNKDNTKTAVATSDVNINSKTTTPALKNVSVVKVDSLTDSKGQAKLILKASDITGLAKVCADAADNDYNAKLSVASKTVDTADLYWVEPELAFKDKTIGGREYKTSSTRTTETVSGNVIAPLSGSTWLYGVYSVSEPLVNIGDLAGKSVKIAGLNIAMAKAASGVGTVEATTKLGQVKATSTKTGKTVIVSKITSSSVTASTSVSVDGASATFAGTGTASINRTLKLEVEWKNNGMTAELLAPNGRVVSGNTMVYAKVTDVNGNAVSGKNVEFKTDDTTAKFNGTTLTYSNTTDPNGLVAVSLTLGTNDKVTVTARVDGISDQTYTMTYVKQSATAPTFEIDDDKDDITEKYKAVFDKDAKTITLVFSDDIVDTSVVIGGITASYVDTKVIPNKVTNMGIDSVVVDGNILTIKVVNVPGTIDADANITVNFAPYTDKGITYTMTSVNGNTYTKTVTFKPDAGKTIPSES